jgi:DNA-binding beta-propeller fold protein YncE
VTPAKVAGSPSPWGVVVAAGNVYWTDEGGGSDGTVRKMPLDGGPPVTLAAGQMLPDDLAVDPKNVYWTTADGWIRSAPLEGGSLVDIASGQGDPQGIASDGTNVYWVNVSSGSIVRAPVGGGPAVTLVTSQMDAWDLAIDATSVYWTSGGGVRKLTPK